MDNKWASKMNENLARLKADGFSDAIATKTVVYLSFSTELLEQKAKQDESIVLFPECRVHPSQMLDLAKGLIGKKFATHSETLLNAFGHLIAQGRADASTIDVYILWGDGSTGEASFDNEGYLHELPIGFFCFEDC